MSQSLVIVIGDPDRGVRPAIESGWLSQQSRIFIPSMMLGRGDLDWSSRVDEKTFIARTGRLPLEGEIGCAAAHVAAYRALLETSHEWALVLESDVCITDQHELSAVVQVVQGNLIPDGHVVSLLTDKWVTTHGSIELEDFVVMRATTAPHGAVAYILDRTAARLMIEEQTPIGSVSDWPVTINDVDFLFVPLAAIHHPTDELQLQSTVAPGIKRSTLVPLRVRIMMWLGVWYALNRSRFDGLDDYYHRILQPRMHRHMLRFGRRQPRNIL